MNAFLPAFLLDCNAKPRTFALKTRHGRKYFDVLNADFYRVMISARTVALFREKNFKGWEAVPVNIDGAPSVDFFLLKINSVAGKVREDAKARIDDYRCFLDLNYWDGSDFFRAEDGSGCMVTQRVVDALIAAGISGWECSRASRDERIVGPATELKIQTEKADSKPAKIEAGPRPTKAAVLALAKECGVRRLKALETMLAESAAFTASQPTKDTAVGATRLGGIPDLPTGVDWPRHDGKPLAFLCQFRLADVSLATGELPKTGLLSFFAYLTGDEQGLMLEENRGAVLYSPHEKKLARARVPDDLEKHFRIDSQAAVIQPIISAPYAGCDDVDLPALKLSEDDVDEYSGNFRWNLDKLNAWGEVRDGSLETDAL